MGELELKKLSLSYGGAPVVEELDLTVRDGEMVALLGPSGSGKTTILRAIAGLLNPDSGSVMIDGEPVDHVPAEKRDAVMVFQKALLFPFMDVERNVAFGLKMTGANGGEVRRRVDEMLALVGLSGFNRRRVNELSGGQQQRVALARALVLRPAVLLLDEPFSNLDANLRHRMRELVLNLQEETGVTTLFVTHDQSEAVMISHRVALLIDGRLRQVGAPRDFYERPADEDVARFFGSANFLEAVKDGETFVTPFGPVDVGDGFQGGSARVTIRPEDVVVGTDGEGPECVVTRVRFEGSAERMWIECEGHQVTALSGDSRFREGDRVKVRLPADKVWVLPGGSKKEDRDG